MTLAEAQDAFLALYDRVDLGQPENIRAGMVFANEAGEHFIAGRMVRERAWARANPWGDGDAPASSRVALPSIRIGDRTLACEVTELRSRDRFEGRERDTGLRRVRVQVPMVARAAEVVASLRDGEPCALSERDGSTRMLARAWCLAQRPDARDRFDLTLELEAMAEDTPGVLAGTFDTRGSLTFGGVSSGEPACTVRDDGSFSCGCGATSPTAHAAACKAEWWAREASKAAWCEMQRTGSLNAAARIGQDTAGACGVVAFLAWCCRVWDASPSGQIAARDAAVAKAIADVPEGCSASGWANVVRVLAADLTDHAARRLVQWSNVPTFLAEDTATLRPMLRAYARARFLFGYDIRQATDGALPTPFWRKRAPRLFAAYEAGR